MPDIWMNVDAAVVVPVNIMPLVDDTDFKTIETAVVYNSAGLALTWNFVTCAGVVTGTAVTPTTAGNYDWSEPVADKGMYAIEIPASGGASINNDTEGVGWFTGVATGVLPWRGPTIGFRRAALNDLLIEGGTASTNMEDFFDGTGYVGGTAKLGIDVVNWKGSAAPAMTGDAYARLGAPAGASVSADVAAVKVDTAATLADTGTDGVVVAAASKTGYALSAAGIQAIWDALTSALTTAGSIGKKLADWVVGSLNADQSAVTVGTVTNLTNAPTSGDLTAAMKSSVTAAVPAAAVVADAVWDELVTGHDGAGKAGAQLWTDIDAIAADVAGLDGAAMRGTDSAALASVCTEARLAELDAVNLPTDIAARATPAQVNAEVLDVLNVDTFAEPGQEAPAATNTLVKKIGYLFKFLRNKVTQDATTLSVYADDGITVDQKATVSDSGTEYTRGEIGSGP